MNSGGLRRLVARLSIPTTSGTVTKGNEAKCDRGATITLLRLWDAVDRWTVFCSVPLWILICHLEMADTAE